MFDELEDKLEKEEKKKKTQPVFKKEKTGNIKIKNRSGQRITLDFKRTPTIRIYKGECTELTKEQFESKYFKNRAKYFSIMEA